MRCPCFNLNNNFFVKFAFSNRLKSFLQELFGAVGAMKRARLIKEGVAEVVYVQKDDATKAIQKYHNRELDGYYYFLSYITPNLI